MIALGRFGFDGSGTSLWKDGAYFGVGEGTVNLYTERVMVALLSLERHTVFWPKTAERMQIRRCIEEAHKFRNCIGYVDGTLIGLEEKPAGSGEDYFSRKSGYAINAMIVVDDQKIIRHVYAGWPGGAHDHRVFMYSKLARFPSDYFANGEYLLAGSAYPTSDITVPTYKKPAADIAENRKFNAIHAGARVAAGHTIGILKGRFKSLKRLRVHIKEKKDLAWAVYWIRVCCILHNLLDKDRYDEEWTEEEANAEENEDDELAINPQADSCQIGRMKREAVKQSVLGRY
ncbi:hypothetical protein RvY_15694 [Ramazzottius varieornatus]|uniref:DDE Tnp4 domain-containing protein n=1 Tax=Ramazzottius varieornatus TaxID=947166 RepID=A0A1D1VVU7_RAMVA|nr:hypothetical protein RvY_15694 [Ramazzottius varieornatus]